MASRINKKCPGDCTNCELLNSGEVEMIPCMMDQIFQLSLVNQKTINQMSETISSLKEEISSLSSELLEISLKVDSTDTNSEVKVASLNNFIKED